MILLNCVAPFYVCYGKFRKNEDKENERPSEEKPTIFKKYFEIPLFLIGAVILISGWIIGQNWAFMNTVQSHAYALTNIHAIFTTLWTAVTCQKVARMEWISTGIVLVAVLMMLFDPSASRKGKEPNV